VPRVHSQVARKDYSREGIKRGDTYYSWTFKNRRGPGTKMRSKTRPRPSQLTRSDYLSAAFALQERVEDLVADSDLPGNVEEIANDAHQLADEQEEKFDNMPEGLQQGDTGQLLEQRRDSANEFADALEAVDLSEWEEDPDNKKCGDCDGTGKVEAEKQPKNAKKPRMTKCTTCEGTGKDDEDAEPKNSDGETEEEYWQGRLDEVQGCDFNIE
jgi:hypothetical protein